MDDVYHHQAEAAELGESSRVGECLDGLFDDLFRHGGNELPHRVYLVDRAVDLIALQRGGIGVWPTVLDFDGRDRPMPVDRRS
jgi:hypothetical protein